MQENIQATPQGNKIQKITKEQYDVVIVGTGAAGLYAALNLAPEKKILMLCKRELLLSNSALAQGGIAAVMSPKDTTDSHFKDSMVAGGYTNDPNSLRVLVEQGPEDVRKLLELGVDFDRNSEGNIHMTLEGGHSYARILHHRDSTGLAIVSRLAELVCQLPNVEIAEHAMLVSITPLNPGFSILCMDQSDQLVSVCCQQCILATGGIGRVYEYTTNSAIATGDGIAAAWEAGASVTDMHLIQFHPTAFAGAPGRERFLISEAVRGEGAILLNPEGERFMPHYDSRGELAPRDVVSNCIIKESRFLKKENFYLDITHKDSDYLRRRFPMIYEKLLEEGFDLTKDHIPVFPCQHYLMGGIDVDLDGQTTLPGLFACGECSHTGVHGNNRLASNSLLEAIVFARRAAAVINASEPLDHPLQPLSIPVQGTAPLAHGIRTEIRSIMQRSFFVTVDYTSAKQGLQRIREVLHSLRTEGHPITRDYIEAKSLCIVAKLVLEEVLKD